MPLRAFHRASLAVLMIVFAIGMAGCAHQPSVQAAEPTSTRPAAKVQKPYLIHLPGIGGPARFDDRMIEGLRDGGLDIEFMIYNWIGHDRGLRSLLRYERNRILAREIAARIVAIHREDPGRKIILTAHSGGNGMLLWALENLPDGMQIDAALLLAPAVSPGYDLTAALRHVRRMYSFHSQYDDVILGLGTRIFGTMDGVRGESAGLTGFVQPPDADPRQYAKLQQFPYDPAWQTWRNFGAHIDNMRRPFAREVLAPLLLTAELPAARPAP